MEDTWNEVIEEISSHLSFVLLGKTGAGKSATGNTILGREAFASRKSPKSVTQDVAVESATVNGTLVTVYDTPGYCDTDLTEDEIQLIYESTFQKCAFGRCVFLLVIKADRFTEEERKSVKKIEKLLGQNRMEKTWILFTRGDELEEENVTIKEFIEETEALKTLVQKYEHRYHVFNNKMKDLREQVKALVTKVSKTCINKCINKARKLNPLKRKKPKPVSCVSSLPDSRIVLLGKSGVGKSAAGNTILGHNRFRSEMNTSSVTCKCSEAQATVSGRSVSVVDTPGFFDTQMSPEELVMEIARSVYVSSPGPHAFLLVFPVNTRFTIQEQQIAQMIELMFGEEVLKYSIILFTCGDQLKGKTIEKLIQQNSALRSLVQQCGGRYQLFNNRDVNDREQVEDLLQKIDSMIQQNGGGHYTNQMYEDAQRFRQEEEEQRLREEEERKQQEEKQRQEEIESLRKETKERVRAEGDVKLKLELDRLKAQMQNERKQQEEIEGVVKETEERVRADVYELNTFEAQNERNQEQRAVETVDTDEATSAEGGNQRDSEQENAKQTNSGFRPFFQKYRKCFFACAIVLGLVVGAVIGGAALWGASICGAVYGGAVGGGAVGAVCGGAACRSYEKRKT